MTTKILTIYEADNKTPHVWYNPKNTIPASELVQLVQTALQEPSIDQVESAWHQADQHRQELTDRYIEEITRLQTRTHNQEQITDDLNRIIQDLRVRLVRQNEKIAFLKSCIHNQTL